MSDGAMRWGGRAALFSIPLLSFGMSFNGKYTLCVKDLRDHRELATAVSHSLMSHDRLPIG